MPINIKFVALLALMSGLAPISIHILLPILPEIEKEFMQTSGITQLSLSLGLFAMAVSTIAYGPAADRFGRKPVLLTGLSIFVIGSLLCFWSPNIETLILGRVVQAAGGAAGMVISRAIVRDVYSREQSAQIIGYMMSIIILAPIFAPIAGAFITKLYGWQTIFICTTLIGIIALISTYIGYKETATIKTGVNFFSEIAIAFPVLIKDTNFLAYTGYASFGVGMFMVFAGGLPFVMVDYYQRPPSDFGFFIMLIMTGFLIGTFLSTKITPIVGIDKMIGLASLISLLIGLSMLAIILMGFETPWAIFGPGALMATCHGLSMPNAQAGGVSVKPSIAGSASGLLIFIQMSVGACFAQLAGMLPSTSALPVSILICFASFLAFGSFTYLIKRKQSAE